LENTTLLYDNDEIIISEYVQNKSNRAANAFVRKYQKFVYHTAYRYLGQYEDADEVAQEVFIKALSNLHKFKLESNLNTWLYRITINQCHNFKLKNKFKSLFVRSKNISDNDDIYDFPDYEHSSNPEHLMQNKELETLFMNALNKLPDKQRETFALRYFDNLTYDEISELLNVSIGGLKANYFHATKKLATELTKYKNGL
jgi:RNA polymerase sigma factor (sigma-70 family)